MADAITITINAVDRTHVIPFREDSRDTNSTLVIEETAPGVATLSARLWDFTNSVSVPDNAEITVTDPTTPGKLLFHGYVTKRLAHINATYRIWTLSANDLNTWLDQKVVGAPDGSAFLQDPPGTYVAFDPNAVTQNTDKDSVQWLFSVYAYDLPVDTTTHVEVLAPTLYLSPIRWNTVTLREALDEIAALTNSNLRYWIDADWFLHWTTSISPTVFSGTAIGPVLTMFPSSLPPPGAPLELVDGPANGITTLNYEDLSVEWDDQGWADSIYVDGATGFTYNPRTRHTGTGGSGWVNNVFPSGRQRIMREHNSDSRSNRDSIGGTILAASRQAVTSGEVTVLVGFGGWRTGQGLKITATPLGINGITYMIQRVTTQFLSGNGWRKVTMEFGDAPRKRIGHRKVVEHKKPKQPGNRPHRPATKMVVTHSSAVVAPGGIVRFYAQAADHAGNAWPVAGQPVTWSVTVYNASCTDVTASTSYALSAATTNTNVHGMAWVDLTTAATANRTYYVTAECNIPE